MNKKKMKKMKKQIEKMKKMKKIEKKQKKCKKKNVQKKKTFFLFSNVCFFLFVIIVPLSFLCFFFLKNSLLKNFFVLFPNHTKTRDNLKIQFRGKT